MVLLKNEGNVFLITTEVCVCVLWLWNRNGMKMDLVGVWIWWEWVRELEEVYILGSHNVYMGVIKEVEATLRILDDERNRSQEEDAWAFRYFIEKVCMNKQFPNQCMSNTYCGCHKKILYMFVIVHLMIPAAFYFVWWWVEQ